jgi:nucleoside-diphosphate-sugar epimerase
MLAGRGHEVHGVIHHDKDAPVADAASLHVADLADRRAILEVVKKVRPDHVVHLAAIAFVGHNDIEEMYRANVVGTRQLLDVLAGLDSGPATVLLASSANIYGNARGGLLDETMLPAPAMIMLVSKVAAEYVGSLYAERLPLITVRPFNYSGRAKRKLPDSKDHWARAPPCAGY